MIKKTTVKPEIKKKPAPPKKEEHKVTKTRPVKPKEPQKPKELPTMNTFPTVKKGDKNGYVTLLQTNLKNRGYYEGPVDGKFGDNTEKAVMAFQKDLGKPLNGSVGPKTWEALQKSTMVKTVEKKEEPNPLIEPESVKTITPPPSHGCRVLIEGLSRYQADLLVKLLLGHTECRIL